MVADVLPNEKRPDFWPNFANFTNIVIIKCDFLPIKNSKTKMFLTLGVIGFWGKISRDSAILSFANLEKGGCFLGMKSLKNQNIFDILGERLGQKTTWVPGEFAICQSLGHEGPFYEKKVQKAKRFFYILGCIWGGEKNHF